jgi:hypothetical protein
LRIDNIQVTASPPILHPVISVNRDSLIQFVQKPGNQASWQLTVSNLGDAPLFSSLSVDYSRTGEKVIVGLAGLICLNLAP